MKRLLLYYLCIVYAPVYGQVIEAITPFSILDYYLNQEYLFLESYDKIIFNVNPTLFPNNKKIASYRGIQLSYAKYIESDTSINCSDYKGKKVLKMYVYLERIRSNSLYWDIFYSQEDMFGDDCFGRTELARLDKIRMKWDTNKQVWYVYKKIKYTYLKGKDGYFGDKRKRI